MSILLDLIVTILTDSNSVAKIGTFGDEVGLCQVMIAIDPFKLNTGERTDEIVNAIIADIKRSTPEREGGEIRYPGEGETRTRRENLANGIPVAEEKWHEVLAM